MSSVRELDRERPRTMRIIATAAIIATIAFLLLSVTLSGYWLAYTSGTVSDPLSPMTPSYQSVNEQSAAPYQTPVASTTDQMSASGMPRPETSPAPKPGAANDLENNPAASEQRVLQTRKALETVDVRELLRQGSMPK
jgi:hypothetical protein